MAAPVRNPSRSAAAVAAGRRTAEPRTAPGAAAELRVLGTRELAQRAARRTASRLTALAVAVVVAALLVVAAAQAVIASRQLQLDAMQQEVAAAVTTSESLQVARADLSAPTRILGVAEHRLAMAAPGSVSYLAPVNPGPSVAEVAARNAALRSGRVPAARPVAARG